jgi:cyclopropane fatty-acyl-phospholipid synthase-like methyltransferase
VQTPTQIPTTHDRSKNRLLNPTAPWLHLLGITNAKGDVLAAHQDKWRQINKYLETIESLLRDSPLQTGAHIADMGSGKGYLTFALYDFLQNHLNLEPHITGIELRPALVDFCNKTAQQVGFQNLQFIAQDIAEYQPESLDMLIALHACDTATDLALAAGIRQKARILVVAPCCHKQIRREMQTQNELAPLLRHGILEERQAELVTDGIRALLLEAEGYQTKVFEFISTEHTAKNVMITATKDHRRLQQRRTEALAQVAALKTGFGIKQHWLEHLLSH